MGSQTPVSHQQLLLNVTTWATTIKTRSTTTWSTTISTNRSTPTTFQKEKS